MSGNAPPQDPSFSGLGPRIRMRPLQPSELPAHPSLDKSPKSTSKSIQSFAASVLEEAEQFMTIYLPKFDKKSDKSSPPSKAQVELYAKQVQTTEIAKIPVTSPSEPENWFARKSIHENKQVNGTATWEEFNEGLRVNHSEHEKDYTPNVLDAHKVLDWTSILSGQSADIKSDGTNGWTDVTACIMEMCHKIPPPLNNRVFPVLVITAHKKDKFLVVQIPVALEGLEGTKYHTDKKVTTATYCSIERCELKENGQKVEWQMATASDAKGNLPMFVQKMGVPGAVVKDVGLFLDWNAKKRV